MLDCAENGGSFQTNRQGYGCDVAWDDGAQSSIRCTKTGVCTMVYVPA